jgi:hypothetical protein
MRNSEGAGGVGVEAPTYAREVLAQRRELAVAFVPGGPLCTS